MKVMNNTRSCCLHLAASLLTILAVSIAGVLALPGSASAGIIWKYGHYYDVTIDPGDSYHFYLPNPAPLSDAHSWKEFTTSTGGSFQIHQNMQGAIHLDPGERTNVMHAGSSHPFQDEEWFTNIGPQNQTLQGSLQIDAQPPNDFGPVSVPPGDSEHISADVNVPDANGEFTMWKDLVNVDPYPNWWAFETENWWNIILPAGGTWSDHHWFGEAVRYDAEWIWIENTGSTPIVLDIWYELHGVPEPETLLLLGLGVAGLLARRRATRRKCDTIKA